jgi:Peptidase inhibitor I78 family
MKRTVATLTLLALSACVPATAADDRTGGPPDDTCGASSFSYLVGQDIAPVLAMTLTQPIRILRPGDAMTMDFSAERLNFNLDGNDRVVSVTCG